MFKNSCDQKTNLLKPHEFLHSLVRSALAPSPSQQALLLTLGMSDFQVESDAKNSQGHDHLPVEPQSMLRLGLHNMINMG